MEPMPTTAPTPDGAEFTGLTPQARGIFISLMLGMLVASISQTIVGPAMPRIVAELGGMEHYSWVATAAMLVSAVSVPVVGKLSDIYGRRLFYLLGLAVFMVGSIMSGLAQGFWFLVFARAVQGFGMGTLMPLSQTIIGDIIPPRQRGKYQGLMGAVFGLSSIVGPLVGGFVTDHWGWRWLFYISLPVGLAAFYGIWRNLKLPHRKRDVVIDRAGILVMTVSFSLLLAATSMGGSTWAWNSPQIVTMYAVGAVLLALFIWIETRAAEPVLPLHLFRSSIFSWSNVASFMVSVMMFGAMIYLPVYAQGVLGVSATESGLILMPMSVSMIGMSIVAGMIITHTGKYKLQTLLGLLVMGVGYYLLANLGAEATARDLAVAMIVFGFGLGTALQVYTLIVQNAAARRDLGVATAATQFFRNVGSTVGIAVFGTILTAQMGPSIASHLSPSCGPPWRRRRSLPVPCWTRLRWRGFRRRWWRRSGLGWPIPYTPCFCGVWCRPCWRCWPPC